MNTNFSAFRQYASRPAEERYWGLEDAHVAAKQRYKNAATGTVLNSSLKLEVIENENIGLVGKERAVPLSNFAMQQLATNAGAPAQYLAKLSPGLVIDNLKEGFSRTNPTGVSRVLMDLPEGEAGSVRCFDKSYNRVWDYYFIETIMDALRGRSFRTPPGRAVPGCPTRIATVEDCIAGSQGLDLAVKPGDLISPSGAYMGQESSFFITLDDSNRIEDGSEGGLYRGAIWRNGEMPGVGYGVDVFYWRRICANHILQGFQQGETVTAAHVGNVGFKLRQMVRAFQRFVDSSPREIELQIKLAQERKYADNPIQAATKLASAGLTKKDAEKVVEGAQVEADGPVTSIYGVVNAITRFSQTKPNMRDRLKVENVGKEILRRVNF